MIRRSAFYFVVAIFFSCTEKETEEDKYPNIPFFPGSSNEKYIFEKRPFRGSMRLENFIVLADDNRSRENVVLFDLRTANLKEILLQGDLQYMDPFDGSMISRINDSTFLRYTAPGFASEIVPFKKYYRIVEDSAKKVRPILDFRSMRTTRKTANEIFPCKTEFGDVYSLIRESSGCIIVDSRAIDGDLQDCDYVLDSPFPKNFLTPFDHVLLGYSFSGSNHIAFGIETNKLNYYRIVFGRDTISFKDNSESFQLYQMRGQNPVILDGYDSLYEVKLK